MNNTDSSFEKVISRLKEYHYIEKNDVQDLWKCCEFLSKINERNSNSEESFIEHSIAVAYHIASWRFDIDVIIAALFHDCMKSDLKQLSPLIGQTACEILRDYFAISKAYEIEASQNDTRQIERMGSLLDSVTPQSFYIVIAERIDILSRHKSEVSDRAIKLAENTRKYLLPQVMSIHAYNLVDLLEELCFQIDNRIMYNTIASIVKKNSIQNDFFVQQSITKLKQIFDKDSNIIPKELVNERSRILSFIVQNRSIISLQRIGIKGESSLEYDLVKIANKQMTAYIDLTLVLKDEGNNVDNSSAHDVFLKYYTALLKKECFYLRGFYATTDKNSFYYLMSDKMQNLYRVFVKTENEYLSYFYGDIISKDNVGIDYIPQQPEQIIKVFKPDGTAVHVNKNTTALDFAFLVHEDIGLHFAGGIINRNEKPVPPQYCLQNGDTVEIKKNKEITAEFRWFRYVNSDLAKNRLIKYFNSKLNKPKKKITVKTKDGTFATIDANSTVLDFAFFIHPDMGLHFDFALVNDKKVPINYILQDQDSIIVKKAQDVRATISWFRHLNSKKGINELINYFHSINAYP